MYFVLATGGGTTAGSKVPVTGFHVPHRVSKRALLFRQIRSRIGMAAKLRSKQREHVQAKAKNAQRCRSASVNFKTGEQCTRVFVSQNFTLYMQKSGALLDCFQTESSATSRTRQLIGRTRKSVPLHVCVIFGTMQPWSNSRLLVGTACNK